MNGLLKFFSSINDGITKALYACIPTALSNIIPIWYIGHFIVGLVISMALIFFIKALYVAVVAVVGAIAKQLFNILNAHYADGTTTVDGPGMIIQAAAGIIPAVIMSFFH